MTEQQPSVEAVRLVAYSNGWELARGIESLCEQRVAAERERWQNRDRQRLEQIATLQETVQSLQSAWAPAMTEQPPSAEAKALAYDTIGFCLGPFLYDNISPRAKDELRDIIAAALDRFAGQRVSAETVRCVEIIQAARAGEVDRDWRAIISMIECGRTAEQIKGDVSS
jgi:hypothetical protein